MTQEQFEERLRELYTSKPKDPKKIDIDSLIDAAISDTLAVAGGEWNNEVGTDRFNQWVWFYNQMYPPKPLTLPESTLHGMYVDYLDKRAYSAVKLAEENDKKTPDFLITKNSREFLNEFKAPELLFNTELQVYKFQTTHSKILKFISKAVKQLHAEDNKHTKPWIVTFASVHFQLNWKSFLDTLYGGVPYDKELSPDFTNTAVYKSVIAKAKEVDLYIWLQVSYTNKSIYQVSFFVRTDSKFFESIRTFVEDMKVEDVSNMDNVITLSWPQS